MTKIQIHPTEKYKVGSIAALLNVDRKTVYRYMEQGVLPFNILKAKPGQSRTPRYCYGQVIINFINKYGTA